MIILAGRAVEDLSFMKGDLMYIVDDNDDDWWWARKKDGGEEGFIPSNYVAEYRSDSLAEK
jgi:fyn-related kinase